MDTYDQTKNGFAEFVGSNMKNGDLTLGFFNNALQFVYDAEKEEKFNTLYLGSHKQFGTPLLDKIRGQPRHHHEKPKQKTEIEDPEKQSTDEESPVDVKKYKKQDTKFSVTSHEEEDRRDIEDSFEDEEDQGNGALIFDDNALDLLDDEEDRHKKQKRDSNRMGDMTQFLINEDKDEELFEGKQGNYESKKGYERSIEVDNEGNLDDEYNDIEDVRGKTTQEILNKSVFEEEASDNEVEKTEEDLERNNKSEEEEVADTTMKNSDKAFFYDGDVQTAALDEENAEFSEAMAIPSKSLLEKSQELSKNLDEFENGQNNEETEENARKQEQSEKVQDHNSDEDFELEREEQEKPEEFNTKEVSQNGEEIEKEIEHQANEEKETEKEEGQELSKEDQEDDESDFELIRENGQEEVFEKVENKEVLQNEEAQKSMTGNEQVSSEFEKSREQQDVEQTKEEQEAEQGQETQEFEVEKSQKEQQGFEGSQEEEKNENFEQGEEGPQKEEEDSDFEIERENLQEEEFEKIERKEISQDEEAEKEETQGKEIENENDQAFDLEEHEIEQTREQKLQTEEFGLETSQKDQDKEKTLVDGDQEFGRSPEMNENFEQEQGPRTEEESNLKKEEETDFELEREKEVSENQRNEESDFELEKEQTQKEQEQEETFEEREISQNEKQEKEQKVSEKDIKQEEQEADKSHEDEASLRDQRLEKEKESEKLGKEEQEMTQEDMQEKDFELEKSEQTEEQNQKEEELQEEPSVEQKQNKEESEKMSEESEQEQENGHENEIEFIDQTEDYGDSQVSPSSLRSKSIKFMKTPRPQTEKNELPCIPETQESVVRNSTIVSADERQDTAAKVQIQEFNATAAIESVKSDQVSERAITQEEVLAESKSQTKVETLSVSKNNSEVENPSIKSQESQKIKNDESALNQENDSSFEAESDLPRSQQQLVKNPSHSHHHQSSQKLKVNQDETLNSRQTTLKDEEATIEKDATDVKSKNSEKHLVKNSSSSQKLEVNQDEEVLNSRQTTLKDEEATIEKETTDLKSKNSEKHLAKNSSQSHKSSQKMDMNQNEVLNSRQSTLKDEEATIEKETADIKSKSSKKHLVQSSSSEKSPEMHQDEILNSRQTTLKDEEEVTIEKETTNIKSKNSDIHLGKNSSQSNKSSQKIDASQNEILNSKQSTLKDEEATLEKETDVKSKNHKSSQKLEVNQDEVLSSRQSTFKDEEVTIEKETIHIKPNNSEKHLVRNSSQSHKSSRNNEDESSKSRQTTIEKEPTVGQSQKDSIDVNRKNLEKPIIKIVSEQGIPVNPNQAKSSNAQLSKNKSSIGSPISSETVQNIDRSISEIPKARDFTPSVSETKFDSDVVKLKDESVSYKESEDAVIEKSTFARHHFGKKDELKPIINHQSHDNESYEVDEYANEGFESAGGITPSVFRNKIQDQESQSKFSSNFPPSKTLQNETIPSHNKRTLEADEYGQDEFESQNASAEKNDYESSEDEYEEVELEDVNKTRYEEKLQEISEVRRQESQEKKSLETNKTQQSSKKGVMFDQNEGSTSSLARTATPQRQESHPAAIVVEDQKSEKYPTEKNLTEASSQKIAFERKESFAPPTSIKSQQHSANQIKPQSAAAQESNNNLPKHTLSEEQLIKITKKVPQAPTGKRRLSGQIRVRTKTPFAKDNSFTQHHQNTSFQQTSVFPEVAQTKKTEQDQKNKAFYEQFTKPRKEKSPHYPAVVAKMDETHNNNRNFMVSHKMGAFIPQIRQEELQNNRTESTPTKVISINKLSSRRGSDNGNRAQRGSHTVSPNERGGVQNNSAFVGSPPLKKKVHQIHINRPFANPHRNNSESSLSCNLETEEDKVLRFEKDQNKKNHAHATQFYFKRNSQDAGNKTFHHHQILRPLNNSKIEHPSKLSSEREQQPYYDVSHRQHGRHASVIQQRNGPNEFENSAYIPRNKDLFNS